jgi:hypothetical protein
VAQVVLLPVRMNKGQEGQRTMPILSANFLLAGRVSRDTRVPSGNSSSEIGSSFVVARWPSLMSLRWSTLRSASHDLARNYAE